jgi:hypothetical protein
VADKEKKTATVKLRLFACLVIRILQDVSAEKAMEQMFARVSPSVFRPVSP